MTKPDISRDIDAKLKADGVFNWDSVRLIASTAAIDGRNIEVIWVDSENHTFTALVGLHDFRGAGYVKGTYGELSLDMPRQKYVGRLALSGYHIELI